MSFVTIGGIRINTAAVVSVERATGHDWERAYDRWKGLEMLKMFESAYSTHSDILREVREGSTSDVPEMAFPSEKDYQVTVVSLSDGRKIEVPGKTVEEVEAMLEPPVQVWPSSPPLPTEFYTW